MNILDPAFVYVPAAKQNEHGVLARWREQRKNMGGERFGKLGKSETPEGGVGIQMP